MQGSDISITRIILLALLFFFPRRAQARCCAGLPPSRRLPSGLIMTFVAAYHCVRARSWPPHARGWLQTTVRALRQHAPALAGPAHHRRHAHVLLPHVPSVGTAEEEDRGARARTPGPACVRHRQPCAWMRGAHRPRVVLQHGAPLGPCMSSVRGMASRPAKTSAAPADTHTSGDAGAADVQGQSGPGELAGGDANSLPKPKNTPYLELATHAFQIYVRMFGTAYIPKIFVVPETGEWPTYLHGFHLGATLHRLGSSHKLNAELLTLEPNVVPVADFRWATVVLPALRVYSEMCREQGVSPLHSNIPLRGPGPDTGHHGGLGMGAGVGVPTGAGIVTGTTADVDPGPDSQDALTPSPRLSELVVPHDCTDPRWPAATHGFNLGAMIRRIRTPTASGTLHKFLARRQHIVATLDGLGFLDETNTVETDMGRRVEVPRPRVCTARAEAAIAGAPSRAEAEYEGMIQQLQNHTAAFDQQLLPVLRVWVGLHGPGKLPPYDFRVPAEDPWPRNSWAWASFRTSIRDALKYGPNNYAQHSPECAAKLRELGIDLWSAPWSPRTFLPFDRALRAARALKFAGVKDWDAWRKSGARPANVPSNPNVVYKNAGWQGYKHWLGIGSDGN